MEFKDKIWIYGLRFVGLFIIFVGIYCFFDCKLYAVPQTNFQVYLRIFLPILVIGISSILFGISKIIFYLVNK